MKKSILVLADHQFDPRIRRKIRWLKDEFGEVFLCCHERSSYLNKSRNNMGLPVVDYDDNQKIRTFNGGICFASGARMLLDKRKVLADLKKKNIMIYEVPDLPLRSSCAIINYFTMLGYRHFLEKSSNSFIITSPAFSKYLPINMPRFLSENIPELNIAIKLAAINSIKGSKVNIAFIGAIRYPEQIILLLIFALKHHSLVRLHFFGGPTEFIYNILRKEKQYDKLIHDEIISIHGPFDFEEEIAKIYSMIDVVYAVYDATQLNVRLALPNKLYEAALAKKPILVAEDTFLGELVMNNHLGQVLPYKIAEYKAYESRLETFLINFELTKPSLIFRDEVLKSAQNQKNEFIDWVRQMININQQ